MAGVLGVGRLDRHEVTILPSIDEAEDQRWVEGAVLTKKGGITDDMMECFACGCGAGEVCGGTDPNEDLLQKVVGEGRHPGFGAREGGIHCR